MITWTVLGSGTHYASARRGSPGHLVEAGGRHFLFDCGAGTFHSLAKAGSAPERIAACFLTHVPSDHVSDLVPLLFHIRNHVKTSGEEKTLRLFGPPGFASFVRSLRLVHAPFLETENLRLVIHEGEHGEESIEGVRVRHIPVPHGIAAIAYSIRSEEGDAAVYSGDTGRSAELVRLARGAALLVIEANLAEGEVEPFHLAPSDAARIAAEAGVKGMLLVHLNPESDDVDLSGACRDLFGGKVLVGEDLLSVRIEGGEVL
ncbi:MAG: MBL fold metallo-hydrolase [Candidatus Eisenbacteria bacterium]